MIKCPIVAFDRTLNIDRRSREHFGLLASTMKKKAMARGFKPTSKQTIDGK